MKLTPVMIGSLKREKAFTFLERTSILAVGSSIAAIGDGLNAFYTCTIIPAIAAWFKFMKRENDEENSRGGHIHAFTIKTQHA